MTIYLPPLEENPEYFPPVSDALDDPDGLLAIGGDLSARRLSEAYRHGIFPWFGNNDPYLWWSPSERAIFTPETFNPSKSLKKFARKSGYRVSINTSFSDVINKCALIRGEDQVWITQEMRRAYTELHIAGKCHSVEVWCQDELVGGLYGVSVGQMFCGESMFSAKTNASKIALWAFCKHFASAGGKVIDCQMMTDHLASLGAMPINRDNFIELLNQVKDQSLSATVYEPQRLNFLEAS
ncbi:leucyl/phenylalanyl-tRNA--protein transferase [Veronia nyctiphanis]|uniref:Leucyl/phenylalanyl-tRNA--protein transferase n=1 Tax=Veronia nyctiphanis TaxID=1278244 RepID=A0A4Q0YS83_9GAMM|nr:leucyl/phenylalanyl-tRNA--protein transferase [Veronia nyctiphanis]RXJ73535.1 leucyl/phenylalanyl-tRNA--protein transferase [Veronia nyctiphanis]